MCSNPSTATPLVSESVVPQSSQVGISKRIAGIGDTECTISTVFVQARVFAISRGRTAGSRVLLAKSIESLENSNSLS